MCAINPKFKRFYQLEFYSSHGDEATFNELLAERLCWMEQAFNESGGIRVHVTENTMTEEEWARIHNALAIYQCGFKNVDIKHPNMRQIIQQLMDKIRDKYISKTI